MPWISSRSKDGQVARRLHPARPQLRPLSCLSGNSHSSGCSRPAALTAASKRQPSPRIPAERHRTAHPFSHGAAWTTTTKAPGRSKGDWSEQGKGSSIRLWPVTSPFRPTTRPSGRNRVVGLLSKFKSRGMRVRNGKKQFYFFSTCLINMERTANESLKTAR